MVGFCFLWKQDNLDLKGESFCLNNEASSFRISHWCNNDNLLCLYMCTIACVHRETIPCPVSNNKSFVPSLLVPRSNVTRSCFGQEVASGEICQKVSSIMPRSEEKKRLQIEHTGERSFCHKQMAITFAPGFIMNRSELTLTMIRRTLSTRFRSFPLISTINN